MKVTSSKPKGQRIFKSTLCSFGGAKKTKRPFHIEPVENGWWFSLETGEWKNEWVEEGGVTTGYYAMKYDGFNDAYSLKAVKRLINKWNVPKNTKFIASLPYIGFEFLITK